MNPNALSLQSSITRKKNESVCYHSLVLLHINCEENLSAALINCFHCRHFVNFRFFFSFTTSKVPGDPFAVKAAAESQGLLFWRVHTKGEELKDERNEFF